MCFALDLVCLPPAVYFTFGWEENPLAINCAVSDGFRPRVSGKYLLRIKVKSTQVAANIVKTQAPIASCSVGKRRATRKLQDQDDTLPKAMPAGLVGTSNISDPMKYGMGPRPIW